MNAIMHQDRPPGVYSHTLSEGKHQSILREDFGTNCPRSRGRPDHDAAMPVPLNLNRVEAVPTYKISKTVIKL